MSAVARLREQVKSVQECGQKKYPIRPRKKRRAQRDEAFKYNKKKKKPKKGTFAAGYSY